MTTNKNERDFVLRYFTAGKLNTVKALQQVKAKAGIASTLTPWWRISRRMSVAASVLMLLAFGAYMLFAPDTITLQTAEAQQVFTLPDSTRVTLAPHSLLSYKENDCRSVEMKGRVYFQVKHDEVHPFEVRGETSYVKVLGTQFEVDERLVSSRQDALVSSVFVTGGRVLFAALQHDGDGIVLSKGMKAVLHEGASRPVLSGHSDVNDVAWATNEFHFSDAPMEKVLRVLGEYYGKTFAASDMTKRLTGDFDARNEEQVIQVIEETLGVVITHT